MSERTSRGRSAWSDLLPYTRPFRWHLALSLALLLFASAMELLKPWPLKFIIDQILGQHPVGVLAPLTGLNLTAQLAAASVLVVVVAIVGGIAEYHAQILVAKIGHTIAASLRGDVFSHLQRLSVSFHRNTGSGEMLTRLMKDVQEIKNVLGDLALETTAQVVLLAGMAAILVGMDARLALVSLAVFGPVAVLTRHYSRHIKDVTRRQRRKDSQAASIMTEAIAMLPAVQLFGRSQHASGQFGRATRKGLEAEVTAARMKGRLERWVEVIVAFGTGAVLWYGAWAVIEGRLTPGDLVIFSAYLRSMYRPTRRIAANWIQASRAAVGAERVMELLRRKPAVEDLPHATPAPAFVGAVEFSGVSFAYGPGMATLYDVTVSVPPGALVAIVGPSGAGKSTLISLIPRLADPSEGSVRIDGRDVRDYTIASLREQIAIVTQEAMLFGLSVRDNVSYGDPTPDEGRVVAALNAAHAWHIVERLAEGLDTTLGERGATLSGGERQRLAIARAFYRDARILILDEPTTGLDSFAEAHVVESLSALVRGRTTFVITHRLSTIAHADLVLYLEDGRLVESGSPASLRATGGRYDELLSFQVAGLRAH
ncbi:MAG: ABC transporter ATP-binding protein [Acidobacteria bacterium]|nr:ABC transporter ATP-binding protein [Acidobacteriota bacterium]